MENIHEGHRQRLRERFEQAGSFEDYTDIQFLELLLCYARPRGDMNPVAHRLLDTFGSLRGVLEAKPTDLKKVDGVGPEVAVLISMVVPMTRRYERCLMEHRDHISNRTEAEHLCKSLLEGQNVEQFFVICLDAGCRVLGQRRIATGSLSEVSAYPRLIVETALNYNAHSVIFTHNHPGGTAGPSAEDIASTLQLQRILESLGIRLNDHIIVAGAGTYSMMAQGDLSRGRRQA